MVNKAFLIGNLTKDPEQRASTNGLAVTNFSIATNERWKDKEGNQQERSEFHDIVTWAKQAEFCGKYLKKGLRVYVEGRIQTREFDDKTGNKRRKTEIVAESVQLLTPRDKQEPAEAPASAPKPSTDLSKQEQDFVGSEELFRMK